MKTTKEQILKAAETSPEAKEALKELFPEAFEPEWETFEGFRSYTDPYIERRFTGNLKGKGLYLHAASLDFTHPITKEKLTISKELPKKFRNIFRNL